MIPNNAKQIYQYYIKSLINITILFITPAIARGVDKFKIA